MPRAVQLDHQHPLELRRHHERRRPLSRLPVPARDSRVGPLQVFAHYMLHEIPYQERDQQDEAQHFDAVRPLQEDVVDDQRVLQEAEVALDAVLLLVGREHLLG